MIAVLFDVDLTLVDAKRAGSRAMRIVFEDLWGWRDATDGVPMAGRTDLAIFREIVERGKGPGVDVAAMMEEFNERYFPLLEELLRDRPAEPCPGIPEVLASVAGAAGLAPGLATGNFRRAAEIKLAGAGIDPSQFAYGAFGEESGDRNEVVRLAIERAQGFAGRKVRALVVGDTALDHAAARACGALCALVGTGLTPFERLEELGPDFLARSLADPDPLISWIVSLRA